MTTEYTRGVTDERARILAMMDAAFPANPPKLAYLKRRIAETGDHSTAHTRMTT